MRNKIYLGVFKRLIDLLIDWLIAHCFSTQLIENISLLLGLHHCQEGLQNLGLCSLPMAFEQVGIFIMVLYLVWLGTSNDVVSPVALPPSLSQEYWSPFLSQEYWPPLVSQKYWPPLLSQEYWPPFLSQEYWPSLLSQDCWPPLLSWGVLAPFSEPGVLAPFIEPEVLAPFTEPGVLRTYSYPDPHGTSLNGREIKS